MPSFGEVTPTLEPAANRVVFTVPAKIYPLECVMGAAHLYLRTCFVLLGQNPAGDTLVSLKAKEPATSAELEALAGGFHNELLHQALRNKLQKQHRKAREYIMARAVLGAEAPEAGPAAPSAALPGEDDDYLDDPLGIAVPWDQKYGKTAPKSGSPE